MRILILDKISREAIEIMKKEGILVDEKYDFPREKIGEIIDFYDGVIVRSKTKLTRDILKNTKKLKLIIRAGVGLDNIDTETTEEKGIIVLTTPGASSISVAELTIGYLICLSRFIPQATICLKNGKWEKEKFKGTELYGKTLGIIGVGRIGREVAKRAKALGMRVLGFDPYVKHSGGIEIVDFHFLIKNSDYITLHTPLTDKTRNIIDKKIIEKMKEGVFIINCARGGLIEEEALYEALKSGKVQGAACDVFRTEPPEKCKLFELNNFICTPHIGSATVESEKRIGREIAELVIDYYRKNR